MLNESVSPSKSPGFFYSLPDDVRWTMKDEISFIDGLGSHILRGVSRLFLLRNYRTSLFMRTQWDELKRTGLYNYVSAQIQIEESKLC